MFGIGSKALLEAFQALVILLALPFTFHVDGFGGRCMLQPPAL